MSKRKFKKLIHEGEYVAEVNVELIDSNEGWPPYLSLEDAYKLDNVRDLLRDGDIINASKLAKIYTLKSVAV